MTPNGRILSLAHLTTLDTAPPELVRIAAQAGFNAVGIRVQSAHPGEEPWPILGDNRLMRLTERSLKDTGIALLDVELIRLHEHTIGTEHQRALEAGARLGARHIIVSSADPDVDRAADNFAALCELAFPLGILPVIEPTAFSRAPTLAIALIIATRNDNHPGGILIDSLHMHRMGASPADLQGISQQRIPYIQLCDTYQSLPLHFDLPARLPRNQPMHAEPIALESRAFRLMPGTGDLPLEHLLRAIPPNCPISVEAPCVELQQKLSSLELARCAITSCLAVLSTITTPAQGPVK